MCPVSVVGCVARVVGVGLLVEGVVVAGGGALRVTSSPRERPQINKLTSWFRPPTTTCFDSVYFRHGEGTIQTTIQTQR